MGWKRSIFRLGSSTCIEGDGSSSCRGTYEQHGQTDGDAIPHFSLDDDNFRCDHGIPCSRSFV